MYQKIRRILSIVLVFVMFLALCPVPGRAVQTEAAAKADYTLQVKKDIETLYKNCLKTSGRYSFHGYCGALVSWQLYLLGITTEIVGANGNDHFDIHSSKDYSSGGYRAQAYSASDFNLRDALNHITANGTKDAYNIVVGFQRTNTQAGRYYGHSMLINAIIDGVVYFSESYTVSVGGKFYPEGAAVSCTIDQFYNFFAPWTVYEGIVQFGLKTYAESCTYYPAYLNAGATANTTLYSAPCTPETDDRSKVLRPVQSGERICVTGLYKNTEGEYWYRVEDTQVGYIRADFTQVLSMRYDDVTVTNIDAPAELKQGNTFDIKGKIRATYNTIFTTRAQVFCYEDGREVHVMSTTDPVDGQSYSLSLSKVSNQLAFRKLPLGDYRYELAVVVGNYYYADGSLQTEWKTLKLWRSNFQVVSQRGNAFNVTFDACGGNVSLNAADVAAGSTLPSLPEAWREGYVFEGWYTADGTAVTEDYPVTGNMVLYARWSYAPDLTGWVMEGDRWVYLENGKPGTGFVESNGITYYITDEGIIATDLMQIDGKLYYFNGNGAMHTGWLETAEGVYYFTRSGALTGHQVIEDMEYHFDTDGLLLPTEE